MKFAVKILAFLMSLLFTFGGASQSVMKYTDGEPITPEKRDYCFDNDRLLIGAYYGDIDHVKEAKEAGIDFIIDSSVDESFLDECQKYGIGVISNGYNLPGGYSSLNPENEKSWVKFDYTQYRNHPALWGDDFIDEPNADAFENIAKSLEVYNANTDGKIGLVNLFPAYANEDQLSEHPERTDKEDFWLGKTDAGCFDAESYKMYISDYINKIPTDYICADIYPYRSKKNVFDKEVKSTIKNWLFNLDVMAEACRGTGRDLWIITQASGETKNGEPGGRNPRYCDEVTDISQQCYACLAFGAKAIIHAQFAAKGWWDPEHSHMIDVDGNTTETYDAVKTVDGYLAAFAKEYGKYTYESTYLVHPICVTGQKDISLATTDPDKVLKMASLSGLLVGTFTSDNGKAYIITNMEELNKNKSAHFTYCVPKDCDVTVYQKGEAKTYSAGSLMHIRLDAGEGIFMTENK